MAYTIISFSVDEKLKIEMEATCKELGISIDDAFTMFATKVIREKRIPFDVAVDPFYNNENIARLEKAAKEMDERRGMVRDIIEE